MSGMTDDRAPLLPKSIAEREKNELVDPLDLSTGRRVGILAGIWSATFLASLNTTLVATLITSISSEFKQANEAAWLGTAYLLATAAFTPLYGRLSNVIGRRGANQLAVGLLMIGTLICGLAKSMNVLIVGRFIAGMGGGGIFTTSSIVTSDMYSIRRRSLTQGIASLFSGAGMGLGGPLGGALSQSMGWRFAFLVQVPFFFVSFALTQKFLAYRLPGKNRSPLAIAKSIDYLGSLCLLLTVGSTLFALSYRYNLDLPANDARVIACSVGAGIGTLLFFWIELRVAVEPVLAPDLLKQRIPILVGISSLLVPLNNFTIMYYFPLWFEVVAGTSSAEAGLHLLPNSVAMSLGSLFAGYMMHKTGKYKTLNLVFGILPFIAACLIARLQPSSGVITKWLSNVPLGFGNAVVLQTTLIALLVSIPRSQMAVGTGFIQLFRGIGQVLGVALPAAIFQNTLTVQLTKRLGEHNAELVGRIRHDSKIVPSLPSDIQEQARQAYAVALRLVFIFGAACTLAAFIIRLPIPDQSLDRQEGSREAEAQNNAEEEQEDDDDSDESEDEEEAASGFRSVSAPAQHERRDANGSAYSGLGTPASRTGEPAARRTTSEQAVSPRPVRPRARRVSTYMSDHGDDPEPVSKSWRSQRSLRRRSSRFEPSSDVSSRFGLPNEHVEEREDDEERN